MGVFEMIVIIVVVGVIGDMYQARQKTRVKIEGQTGAIEEVASRLEKIERRLGNLEEIVLEREKEDRFQESL